MPKDEWNNKARIFKADMYEKNSFSIPPSWSYLILYEPSWYEAGYFQFYTYVEPIDKLANPDPVDDDGKKIGGSATGGKA